MAERSYPFTKAAGSTTDPGTTSDAEFSAFFRLLAATGVSGTAAGTELKAYGNSSGMSVFVPGGAAIVRGHFYTNSSVLTKAIAVGGAQPRIDSVVLRVEYAGVNDAHVVIKQGTPAASPVAPALTQTDTGVYEMLLATVAVAANAVTVAAGNVTDRRTFTGVTLASIGAAASGHSHNLPDLDSTLPVTKGGTGGTTQAAALKNLGIQAEQVALSGTLLIDTVRTVAVTFTQAFASIPIVVASQFTGSRDVTVWPSAISKTGFTMNFGHAGGQFERTGLSAMYVATLRT